MGSEMCIRDSYRADLEHSVRRDGARGDYRVEHGARGRPDHPDVHLEFCRPCDPAQATVTRSRDGGGRNEPLGD